MINIFKNFIRDLIPRKFQVPIKYYVNHIFSKNEKEMYLIKELVNKNSFSIDIGGNRGVYAFYLYKISKQLKVFEPNPECYNILKYWSKNISNIEIIKKALSNKIGVSNLLIPIDKNGIKHDASGKLLTNNNYISNSVKYKIETTTLDNCKFPRIDFIKIDVEGHELNIIKGATKTLSESQPALLIEIEERHSKNSIKKMNEVLASLNYNGFFYFKRKILNINDFDSNLHQNLYDFKFNNKKYINNFFFLHSNKIKNGNYNNFFKQFDL